MMKYAHLYPWFFVFVFCGSKGQNQTHLPPDTIKPEIKEVITSHGPNTSVRTIKQDRKGNIWLASNEGVIRYDGTSFTNITGKLSSDRFFSLLEDKKGNFWFATNGSGVYYYDGNSFLHFTTKQGLVNNQVSTMYEDKSGNIWVGANGGVSRYDGTSFRSFTTTEALSSNDVNSIMEDKEGKLWFGTRGNTYVYNGKTVTVFTYKGNSFTDVWSIIEDRKGNVWLGGGNGLWRYDGRTFSNLTESSVSYVYEDTKGNIWTSSRGGRWALSRYDEKFLSTKKPAVTELKSNLGALWVIFEANDGSVWLGAADGVYRYDGNTITDFKR